METRKLGLERLVGEKLLNYVGMVLLVLGGVFFLKYTADFYGPVMKILLGTASAAGLVGFGEALRRKDEFAFFSVPVIGGGWILLYYTVYAAHYIQSARLIADPRVELVLLILAAGGMILHSLHVRSRWLTVFSFGTAFFVFLLTNIGMGTLVVCGILAVAAAYLVKPLKSPELAAVSLVGFYLNYFPVFSDVLAAASGHSFPTSDFWYSLGIVTAVQAALLWRTPLGEREGDGGKALDVCLSLSAILYAALSYAQITAFGPAQAVGALLGIAGVLAGLSALSGKGEGSTALPSVSALLSAAITFLALVKIVPLASQFWGFALAAAAFGTVGLWLNRRSFEIYGLGLAMVNVLLYWAHLNEFLPIKNVIGASLLFLGAAGYLLAVLRERSGREGRGISGAWAYTGMFYVLLALACWFEAAAFAVAALAFAIVLDAAAGEFDATPLFQQAILLQVFVGLYSFIIDYGSNLPVLGPLTPRFLVTISLTAAFAAVTFLRSGAPEGRLLGFEHAQWRRVLPWMMTAVAAFGVYQEYDPRLRLPIWSLSALGLLLLGRRRGPIVPTQFLRGQGPAALPGRWEFGKDLRAMAYLMVIGTAVEGVSSYLLYPDALIEELGWIRGAIFCGSAALLLTPLSFPQWAKDDAERWEETAAEHLFSVLSLTLIALFIAKEAQDLYVTLGCSIAGAAYLFAGLYADKQALRLPGLALLGVCVLKAFFLDLTGLDLPYRVLSYMVLGGLLVLSSYIYVRIQREERSDAA